MFTPSRSAAYFAATVIYLVRHNEPVMRPSWLGAWAGVRRAFPGSTIQQGRRSDRPAPISLQNSVVQNGREMASRPKGIPKGANAVPFGQLPTRVNKGRILVHNHVDHSVSTICGRSGFQAWTQPVPPPQKLVKCNCGWAGLPHYRVKGDR
jgi:hypothetical protein